MQQVISISINNELLDELDNDIKNSVFSNRSQAFVYVMGKYLHKKRFDRIERVMTTLGMLLGFAVVIFLIVIGR